MRDITRPRKKKHYPQFSVRVADALTLQQRIAAGEATPVDERAYQRILALVKRLDQQNMRGDNTTDLVHVITEQRGVVGNPQMDDEDVNPDTSNVYEPTPVKTTTTDSGSKKQGLSLDLSMGVQSDAPSCNVCGHTTIRSGTCYKCLNCGNSMGCS